MISLVALYPNHLNLNGDLANIKVLQRRLSWRGVESTIRLVEKGKSIPSDCDFILIGHGSEAAWNDIEEDFDQASTSIAELFTNDLPGLAVASGYERLARLQLGAPVAPGNGLARTERVSKFALASIDGHQALGYINSDAALEPLVRYGNVFGTLLHGPVLAKNEWLAETLIRAIFDRRGLPLPPIMAKEKADQVADLISKVWELEEPLARE